MGIRFEKVEASILKKAQIACGNTGSWVSHKTGFYGESLRRHFGGLEVPSQRLSFFFLLLVLMLLGARVHAVTRARALKGMHAKSL